MEKSTFSIMQPILLASTLALVPAQIEGVPMLTQNDKIPVYSQEILFSDQQFFDVYELELSPLDIEEKVVVESFLNKLASNMVDQDPEIAEIVNEDLWDLY